MNTSASFIRFRIPFAAAALSAVFAAFLSACSLGDQASGNSAESGNPEFAGIISLPDGTPAASARVRFVPAFYNAFDDSLPDSLETRTDSLGRYSLRAPSAAFALEAFDSATGMRLLSRGITAKTADKDSLSDTLRLPGVLRIGATLFADGETGVVYAPGTSVLSAAVVKFGAIFVDSLPAAHFDTLIFVSGRTRVFLPLPDSGVDIPAGDTVVIDAPLISISFKAPLAFPGGDTLARLLTDFPIALRLDSSMLDFSVIGSLSGRWEASRSSRPSIKLPIVCASFDAASRKAVFWVRVDSLLSKDTLLLSFKEGDSAIAVKDVFPYRSSGGRFIVAWHFDEGTSVAKNAAIDTSIFADIDGIPSNVRETEGVLGEAFLYDGTSSYVDIVKSASGPLNFAALDTFSVSAWVRLDDMSTSRFVFGKGSTQYSLKYFFNSDSSSWLFERYVSATSGSLRHWTFSDPLSSSAKGSWKLLTVVQKDSTVSLYVNDTLVSTEAKTGTFETARDESFDFEIGRRVVSADSAGQYFKGAIDEMQINETARDSNWVRVTYWNGRPDKIWPVVTRN